MCSKNFKTFISIHHLLLNILLLVLRKEFQWIEGKEAMMLLKQLSFLQMTSLQFVRICRLFRVGDMLRLGAIKSRMRENHGLPCSEFLYQIMQSYDWYQLSQKYDCYFQVR